MGERLESHVARFEVKTRFWWLRRLFLADGLPQFARNRHRLQRGVHDLGRARFLRRVLRLGLEQLGVRENHAELVIELVQQGLGVLCAHRRVSLHSEFYALHS